MADTNKAVEDNVPGEFFVDTTCINCDTCRQLARATFKDQGEYSYVFNQPADEDERRAATRALLCCPTGSIGTRGDNLARSVMEDLPLSLAENVYYCGFNSEKSFGANSYFVVHPDGNWLIDSPKFVAHLVDSFEKLGGIKYIFLTHRDDVADAAKYATKFGAKRIIHADDADSVRGAEIVIEGEEEVTMAPEFKIIPVPGHTRGHAVLLYEDKFLFTGDHLAYDPETQELEAFRGACWYSWDEQTKSMERLLRYRFEWVLAGHGDRTHLDAEIMQSKLTHLVERMKLPKSAW
ncbi:MAG TPA: MBL fold metallo-hydrolase [Planktothrix sp.]|jgi:glyoxylase-like metal-dependent hydrolase (beta-lactamase superfamily II)/ferredoxin